MGNDIRRLGGEVRRGEKKDRGEEGRRGGRVTEGIASSCYRLSIRS